MHELNHSEEKWGCFDLVHLASLCYFRCEQCITQDQLRLTVNYIAVL